MYILHQILYYYVVLSLVVHCIQLYSYCTFSEDSICPGGPRHKPFGFLEDLHGHNYVFVVLS